MKTYNKYLKEIWEVEEPAEEPSNEISDSNSPIIGVYSKGKGLDIPHNSKFFELAKIIKDFTDRKWWIESLTYDIQMAHRKAIFKFVSHLGELRTTAGLETAVQTVASEIERKYPGEFSINIDDSRLIKKNDKVFQEVVFTIKEKGD